MPTEETKMRVYGPGYAARYLLLALAIAATATGTVFALMQPAQPAVASGGMTSADAEMIALAEYPGATVLEVDLDDEDGVTLYSLEVDTTGGRLEITVDPQTGQILSAKADGDSDDDQASIGVATDDHGSAGIGQDDGGMDEDADGGGDSESDKEE